MMAGNKDQFERSRAHAEVQASLLSIQQVLHQLGDQQACVLHCMQPHRPDFYRRLEHEFGVLVQTDQQRVGLRAAITKALGLSALIVLNRYEELPTLFFRISEQATAALYVVARSTTEALPEMAQLNASEIVAEIKRDPTHLMYQVDEDAATADGRMVEVVSAGPDCPQALKEAVGIGTARQPAS
jgi:hypothetical protein